MRFLIDAQLPQRLARQLTEAGHDVVHTAHLSEGNRTSDQEVNRLADEQDRVVISKDRDFRDSHLLRRTPRRLLVVSTGNISNDDLLALFEEHLADIVSGIAEGGVTSSPDRSSTRASLADNGVRVSRSVVKTSALAIGKAALLISRSRSSPTWPGLHGPAGRQSDRGRPARARHHGAVPPRRAFLGCHPQGPDRCRGGSAVPTICP